MDERVVALLNELCQLCEQYKSEVPSRRRAWPQSIKKRVFELRHLGMKPERIAQKTAIPLQTIYSWRNRKSEGGAFLPVAVVAAQQTKRNPRAPTVTVRAEPSPVVPTFKSNPNFPTVTVVTPGGFRLEGLTLEMVRELMASVESGGVR